MKKYSLLLFAILVSGGLTQAQSRNHPNIINYFASNNQVIGVPMVDSKNLFRFYPDLSFQDAITGVEVYYFVLNDVYKHHLVKREGGRYWEATLREFSLGEAIQRVEVIVDCDILEIKKILNAFGLDGTQINDMYPYLMIRRGDDKGIYLAKQLMEAQNRAETDLKNLNGAIQEIRLKINESNKGNLTVETKLNIVERRFSRLASQVLDYSSKKQHLKDATDSLISARDSLSLELSNLNKIARDLGQAGDQLSSQLLTFKSGLSTVESIYAQINTYSVSSEYDILRQISREPSNQLFAAYVENRLSSMLDMKYKPGDKNVIQFNYRNDKQSLQYLQADDPQEKLGIFRARLVPFPFYRPDEAPAGNNDHGFSWQRGLIVYEIGINFGYTVVKGDHFLPKFFDMNRMGIGIGITSDTFSDNPSFLSLSLTYDINTYTSISFGANLVNKPGFFMGVGINARAFKDLVKNSGALFKSN